MDYEKACNDLVNAVAHCHFMVQLVQTGAGAKEPETAKVIDDVLIVLENALRGVEPGLLLKSLGYKE